MTMAAKTAHRGPCEQPAAAATIPAPRRYARPNAAERSRAPRRPGITTLGSDARGRGRRVRAAEHGRSMEEEGRDILRRRVMCDSTTPRDLAAAIRARVCPGARADLELPAREPMREPAPPGRQAR